MPSGSGGNFGSGKIFFFVFLGDFIGVNIFQSHTITILSQVSHCMMSPVFIYIVHITTFVYTLHFIVTPSRHKLHFIVTLSLQICDILHNKRSAGPQEFYQIMCSMYKKPKGKKWFTSAKEEACVQVTFFSYCGGGN